jgi:hypothetical protein
LLSSVITKPIAVHDAFGDLPESLLPQAAAEQRKADQATQQAEEGSSIRQVEAFNKTANRGSLRMLFSMGSTPVAIRPGSRWV